MILGEKKYWISTVLNPLKNVEGRITSVMGITRDISHFKKSEEEHTKAIAKSEAARTIGEIIENMMDVVILTDSNACISRFNVAFTKSLGWNSEIEGKSIYEIIAEKEIDVVKSKIKEVFDNENSVVFECSFHSKNQSKEIPVLVSVDLIKDMKGKKAGLVIVAKDISDRVHHERVLLEERDKAQKYLDIAGVIFVALDNNGEVILINRKGCEVLGYEENEIIGKNWFDNFIPKRNSKEIKAVSEKVFTGEIETVEYYENTILTKSGEERIIAWHNTLIHDDAGKNRSNSEFR